MRKNLLTNVLRSTSEPIAEQSRPPATRSGASRSMIHSIEEMAENAKRMADGETIVSLDPGLLDQSFLSDRLAQDDEEYVQLRQAIAERGQNTPILVRPHQEAPGRYMIVYGHRRARACAELGKPVRAVVKEMEQIAHIVAQGQENSARANLSFIEKAMFAQKLLTMGQGKDVVKSALSIDDTLLSRMLSVAETIPAPVIDAVGAARGIGRDRWEELKKLLAVPAKAAMAVEIVGSETFAAASEPERFSLLLTQVKAGRKPPPRAKANHWSPPDKTVEATFKRSGKMFSLSLTAQNAAEFGDYLSSNLESLYEAFQATRNQKEDAA